MSDANVMPAPEFPPVFFPRSKWESEWDAFLRLKPSLIPTHPGQYVAIHNGQVVESGKDQIEVALRAYAKYGYTPIYVGFVSSEPQDLVRVPSPRLRPAKE